MNSLKMIELSLNDVVIRMALAVFYLETLAIPFD